MTSKAEVLEGIKSEMLELARHYVAEYKISMEDALELVKALIREALDSRHR